MENILHQMRSSFASIHALALAFVVIGTASQGAGTGGNTRKTSSISQMPSNCQRQPIETRLCNRPCPMAPSKIDSLSTIVIPLHHRFCWIQSAPRSNLRAILAITPSYYLNRILAIIPLSS